MLSFMECVLLVLWYRIQTSGHHNSSMTWHAEASSCPRHCPLPLWMPNLCLLNAHPDISPVVVNLSTHLLLCSLAFFAWSCFERSMRELVAACLISVAAIMELLLLLCSLFTFSSLRQCP